jgi:AraC-like DNA-binding protein
MARPTKMVDERALRAMAEANLNNIQIADALGISIKTLKRRYGQIVKDSRSSVKAKLAIKALQMAMKGNWGAMKYQLSNQLGWSEKVTIDGSSEVTGQVVVYRAYNPADLKEK